jgi:hypothetical protein
MITTSIELMAADSSRGINEKTASVTTGNCFVAYLYIVINFWGNFFSNDHVTSVELMAVDSSRGINEKTALLFISNFWG